jgi:hypothetical protein
MVLAMITAAPEKIPAPPSPAMARPTIKLFEEGEVAQSREPDSSRVMAVAYTHFSGNMV